MFEVQHHSYQSEQFMVWWVLLLENAVRNLVLLKQIGHSTMLCALRRIFATIMVFCECTNIRTLWDKHFESMAEDYVRGHGNFSSVEQFVLRDIADIISSMGKDIRNYGLPHIHQSGNIFSQLYLWCCVAIIIVYCILVLIIKILAEQVRQIEIITENKLRRGKLLYLMKILN